ncbi:MAG: RDD family protein [Chloroflexota bacterium]|nr:RDD family protein [Chloroflexota bacterium]
MEQVDEQFQIATPELVEFGYEVAGVGSRFIAALLDTALIGVIYLLIQLAAAVIASTSVLNSQGTGFNYLVLGVLTVLGFVVLWGYYVFFETLWNGQTPGKRLTHLRVVRAAGSPITFWEVLIRNLVRIVDFLPLGYGIGVLTMFVNGRSRRLGDFAAGTLVVREGSAVTLPQLLARTAVTAGAPASPLAADLDVRLLTPADLYLVREVLARQATLQPLAAWTLGLRATQVVAARTGLRGTVTDQRAFLTEVLRLAESRGAAPAHSAAPAPSPLPSDTVPVYAEPLEVQR